MDKDLLNLGVIKEKLRTFSEDRDWTQYHSPKNLVMALSVEVSELVEIFQWSNSRGIDEINDPKQKEKIKKELADIFNYLVKLIDLLDVDIETEALQKIKENAEKYPIEKVKGKSAKYTDLLPLRSHQNLWRSHREATGKPGLTGFWPQDQGKGRG